MRPRNIFLSASLMTAICFGIQAKEDNNKLPAENYQNKIVDMQKSIASLREEIERIRTERNSLQLKMEQSDQSIASQMQKITTIENSVAENKKTIEALETEKKS